MDGGGLERWQGEHEPRGGRSEGVEKSGASTGDAVKKPCVLGERGDGAEGGTPCAPRLILPEVAGVHAFERRARRGHAMGKSVAFAAAATRYVDNDRRLSDENNATAKDE